MALDAAVAPLRIGMLNLVVPLSGFLLGGAIAGRSLRMGKRGVVGFAIAFVVALPILTLTMIGIQGMGGDESLSSMVPGFGGYSAVAFALMGGVGVAIAGLGASQVLRSAGVFGCAGFVGGLLLAGCLAVSQPGNRTMNQILLMVGAIAFLLLPAAVGGSLLPRQVASDERARVPRS